ncbi:cytochrome P450 [Mycena crocata]|nr:cytochrome P450 [Mycena crocata]
MFLSLAATLFASVTAYALYHIVKAVYAELTSPHRNLQGPRSSHWFLGNLKDLVDDRTYLLEKHWFEQYGKTIKFHELFGQSQLLTADTKALHHILSNTRIYQKSEGTRTNLGRIVGPGILVVEDDAHRQQRKVMNPAFGAPQIRALTSIFNDTSIQLRNIWLAQAAGNRGVARVEALSWLNKATLDIIALAGFNYRINALGATGHDTQDELAEAFEAVSGGETGLTLFRLLEFQFPALTYLPTKRNKIIKESQATIMRIGRQLLNESKREIAENGTFDTGRGRDLLTLLVMILVPTPELIPESRRLSDEEVIAQVPTFLVAGHETTSTSVTWALFALTQHPVAQKRLRDELFSISTDEPTMDELNSLPFLECFVREVLRLYAPVVMAGRMAVRDDVIPLATPVTDIHGNVHQSIRIRKGDELRIPITALNCDTDIWGPDAMEFVPERWEATTPISNTIPGAWGQMLTFLGGTRACIGFKFSLVETKAMLFTLVRAFEFELAVPVSDIGKKRTAIVVRPILVSDPSAGNQLPLLIRPVVR